MAGILSLLFLSTTHAALAEDLGDGLTLIEVDSYSSVVVAEVSRDTMRGMIDYRSSDISTELYTIAQTFYNKFEGEHDFLFFVCFSDLGGISSGSWYGINNDVAGIGLNTDSPPFPGLPPKLNGSLILQGGADGIYYGTLLHELAHRWMVYLKDYFGGESHWGFSNAGGVLGGFKNVEVLGGNQYRGSISPNKSGFSVVANFDVPFSDIELYLMGLKSAQELRSAGFKLDIYDSGDGSSPPGGNFTSAAPRSYTIDQIIGTYGERVPDSSASQKHFKAAVIVLTDGSITPNYSRLVAALRWFAGGINDRSNTSYRDRFNFAQATGGRATIEIHGLRGGGGGGGSGGSGGGGGCNAGGIGMIALFATFMLVLRKSRKP